MQVDIWDFLFASFMQVVSTTCSKSANIKLQQVWFSQLVDNLQQAGKIHNLQLVCGVPDRVDWNTSGKKLRSLLHVRGWYKGAVVYFTSFNNYCLSPSFARVDCFASFFLKVREIFEDLLSGRFGEEWSLTTGNILSVQSQKKEWKPRFNEKD